MGCRAAEQTIVDLIAGELDSADRRELDAHAQRCPRCGAALRQAVATSLLLERAYRPLRARTAALSPARVRLVTRAPQPEPRPSWLGIFGRLSEATMALAFAAVMVSGTFDATPSQSSVSAPSVLRDYFRVQPPADDQGYIRWMRLRAPIGAFERDVRYPAGGMYDIDSQGAADDGWLVKRALG